MESQCLILNGSERLEPFTAALQTKVSTCSSYIMFCLKIKAFGPTCFYQ